jgi:hypothetical protein
MRRRKTLAHAPSQPDAPLSKIAAMQAIDNAS